MWIELTKKELNQCNGGEGFHVRDFIKWIIGFFS